MDKLNFYKRLQRKLYHDSIKNHSSMALIKKRAKILNKVTKRIKELEKGLN